MALLKPQSNLTGMLAASPLPAVAKTPRGAATILNCKALGKIENCIVRVHLGYHHGDFTILPDSDLYLPQSWAEDRKRCQDGPGPVSPDNGHQSRPRPLSPG
jgi:hypothetical protein